MGFYIPNTMFIEHDAILKRIREHNPNSCLLCHTELFWFRHSCEPLFYDDSLELEYQALDKPTLLT